MKNIWVPLSGQIAQQRKVETISNNIANANTAGFKKDRLTFKEHLTALEHGVDMIDLPNKEWSPQDFYRSQGAENALVETDASYTIFEQGPLQPTNNPLDLALQGKGFFEVLTPHGVRYTRNGTFTLSSQGEIVNQQGHKLLSHSAANQEVTIESRIIKIPTTSRISISKEGEIFSQDGVLAKISVVEFTDVNALRKQGSSLFISNNEQNIMRNNIETKVNQGFIEGSNVNAIREMSELIQAHRHFENIQKAISTYDNISGRAVNDISKF